MITKSEIKKYLIAHEEELGVKYNESEDALYKDEEFFCTMDEYVKTFRLNTGQSFTSIYSCGGSLLNVIRCNKCGTVIFSSDDYENYEEDLKCPTCTNYKTHFTFWTKEEIESDEKKKNEIEFYEELTRKDVERYEREKKRGKRDCEITKRHLRTKKHKFDFILGCNDISESYLKGLRYEIVIWERDKDKPSLCTMKKHIVIPLSWSQLYLRHIYRHLGKCHPDMRSKWYIGKPVELNDK